MGIRTICINAALFGSLVLGGCGGAGTTSAPTNAVAPTGAANGLPANTHTADVPTVSCDTPDMSTPGVPGTVADAGVPGAPPDLTAPSAPPDLSTPSAPPDLSTPSAPPDMTVVATPDLSSAPPDLTSSLCSNVSCVSDNVCMEARCDPASGECFDSPVPDGTSCGGEVACYSGSCQDLIIP
jgi:hypothetical protein